MVNIIRHRKILLLKRFTALKRLRMMRQVRKRQIEDQQAEEAFPVPTYDISVSSLPFMSRKQRQQLRRQNKNLPCYMFMDRREKKIYFKRKAKQYQRKLLKSPPKISPCKKKVHFTEEYDVRPFEKDEQVQKVGMTPSFKDTYSFDHYCY